MDSIDSADFSTVNFVTAMETPNSPCEETPVLLPRASTPYSYIRKKALKIKSGDAEPRALCGTVSASGFLAAVIVIKLLALASLAHMALGEARFARGGRREESLAQLSWLIVVVLPALLLALVAIRTGRSVLLLPYLILQMISNLLLTVVAGNLVRLHGNELVSRIEFIAPILLSLLIPYALWTYITYIALRQVFVLRHRQNLRNQEKQRDVERPTTDDDDLVVFERPRRSSTSAGRKVRFADLQKK